MELRLPSNCLAVFVDDSGHEELARGHPVYGMGGCAALAFQMDELINSPWRHVREFVTGSLDTPLHASEFSRAATKEQIDCVAHFFKTNKFARIGAVLSTTTVIPDEITRVRLIAGTLMNRIADIARWSDFQEVAVIIESSERANPLVQEAFSPYSVQKDGSTIPTSFYFMPKLAGYPALEVADFVMHAVQRQAKRKLRGENGFELDFAATFHEIDHRLVSYMDIERCEVNTL